MQMSENIKRRNKLFTRQSN